jgi:hypothetical protein
VLAISTPDRPNSHSFAIAGLVSWLITEAFGAYMLTAWIGSGGIRRSEAQGGVPRSVIFGHAGLAFTGFVWWIVYVVTREVAFAWLSVCFLAPAIGLGISTLTLWTPYPAHRPSAEVEPSEPSYEGLLGGTTDELTAALEDEALTGRLVDELVASALDRPARPVRAPKGQFTPLVPVIHGVLAMATVLLAVLAAVSAS